MKTIVLFCAIIGTCLGGLWLMQGLGAIQLAPILCFADCAEVQGKSLRWAIVGGTILIFSAFAIFWYFNQWPFGGRQK